MPKQLAFDTEARESVLKGVEKLSRAVVSTLGPKGRTAVLDKSWGGPTVTKDGVSVAQEIELRDKNENLGAQLVKEAASKTSDRAGDGTTTATLLAAAIFGDSMRYLTAGADTQAILRGVRAGAERTRKEISKMSKDVKTNAEIKAVATIASNNSPAVGKRLADAFAKVGNDGVITIDEGRSLETEVKVVEGMQFDRGFLSPHFATDVDTLECVLESPYVLVHEEKITSAQTLLPILEKVKEKGVPLVIIAEDIESEALATLVVNKVRGILNIAAVKAPGYGDRRKEMLRDIATVTNAEPLMKDSGFDLEKLELSSLGRAKKILIDNNNTTIIQGAGKKADIQARAELIRRQIAETTSDYDREKFEERLAKLVGGIAQILVGGATESEVKEKKARYEDARSATKAAIEEGVLPGGGTALLRAAAILEKHAKKVEGDEAIGWTILAKALGRPVRAICENAGLDGSAVARKVLAEKDPNFGFNALTEQYGDLVQMGVVDPLKVTRTALENAVSVASVLMTTECLITEAPTKNEPAAGHDDYDGDF